MKKIDSNFSIRDLQALLTMIDAKTVTLASERLGMSQSALSHQLERMRRCFSDPLFARVGNRMCATPRALELAEAAHRILGIVETDILASPSFEPGRSDRMFCIGVSEIGAVFLVPRLLKALASSAPGIRLEQAHVNASTMAADLESGALDLAAGHVEPAPTSLVQRLLYRRKYVCIAARSHPRIKRRVSLAALQRERFLHLPRSAVINAWRKALLSEYHCEMLPPMLTHHSSAIPFAVANSELLAIVPEELFERFASAVAVKAVDLPMPLPLIDVRLFWHPRMSGDPAHRFFRNLVFEAAQG